MPSVAQRHRHTARSNQKPVKNGRPAVWLGVRQCCVYIKGLAYIFLRLSGFPNISTTTLGRHNTRRRRERERNVFNLLFLALRSCRPDGRKTISSRDSSAYFSLVSLLLRREYETRTIVYTARECWNIWKKKKKNKEATYLIVTCQ